MGGFFGAASKNPCINDIFYGTDYNSHLGTKRAGIVTFDLQAGFTRSIHNIERNYFRARFEDELDSFVGNSGVGVISDTDPQPIVVNSHLGRYAVVTVAKINNIREIADELLEKRMHFSERSANTVNPTEVVALLINMGDSFVDGINLVYSKIKGSCSMLILTENGILAARDYLGRTPIVIGRKEGAYAATSETTAFPNLGYERLRDIGPGELSRSRPTVSLSSRSRPVANRYARSSGFTTGSPPATTTTSMPNLCARQPERPWERKTTLKPTASAAFLTQASVSPSATAKVVVFPITAPC